MISVVIPTLDAQGSLPGLLAALVPAAVDGLVREVIVVDAGSTDATLRIADDAGARIVRDLAEGYGAAKADWLLVLTADFVLREGWERAAADHIARRPGKVGWLSDGGRRVRLWSLRRRARLTPNYWSSR